MEERTLCGDGKAKNWDCMYMETVYLGKWDRVSVNIRNPFSFGDAEWWREMIPVHLLQRGVNRNSSAFQTMNITPHTSSSSSTMGSDD
jgi:hypothetical protein